MKKSQFKIDFSKRDTISLVCFTVVMIIVLVLGNSFGFVSAEESEFYDYDYMIGSSTCFLNNVGWQNSSIYDSSVSTRYQYADEDSSNITDYTNFVNGFNLPNYTAGSGSPSAIDYSGYDAYVVCSWSGNIHILMFPSECTFFISQGMVVIAPDDSYTYLIVNISSSGDSWVVSSVQQGRFYTDWGGGTTPSLHIDYVGVLYSNTNIWTSVSTHNTTSTIGMYQDCVGFINGENDYYVDTNYYLYNGGVGNVNNGGILSRENDSNNMYLDNCKFTFSFNPYINSITDDNMKYVGNYNKGNVSFSAMLNDYQIDNLSHFKLKFKFQVLIRGTGYLPFNNPNVEQLDDGHEFYGNFFYVDTSKTLTDLYNGSCYWNADTLWDNMTDSTSVINGTTMEHFDSFLSQVSEYKEVDWQYFKIYATAFLISDDEGESDTNRMDTYNFLDGTTKNLNDSLGTNYNPYVDDTTGTVSGDEQHIESGSGSSSSGSASQWQYQNVTVNNSVSTDVQNEIANIIGSTDDDDDSSSWINTLTTILSTNSFLALMSETFGFMPSSFWTAISTFFITCLSFLTGFCLLRLLFDLI